MYWELNWRPLAIKASSGFPAIVALSILYMVRIRDWASTRSWCTQFQSNHPSLVFGVQKCAAQSLQSKTWNWSNAHPELERPKLLQPLAIISQWYIILGLGNGLLSKCLIYFHGNWWWSPKNWRDANFGHGETKKWHRVQTQDNPIIPCYLCQNWLKKEDPFANLTATSNVIVVGNPSIGNANFSTQKILWLQQQEEKNQSSH